MSVYGLSRHCRRAAGACFVLAAALFAAAALAERAAGDEASLGQVATERPAPPSAKPQPPDNAIAAKAFAVLDRHCARCHQAGALERQVPAGSLGNILMLSEIAREPGFVDPGSPDTSRLYALLLQRHRPAEVFASTSGKAGPSAAEIEAVRDWIKSLSPAPANCADRAALKPATIESTVTAWLEAVGAEAAKDTRFVSLAHLYNACASEADMAGYRQAMLKLLNGLSWAPMPAKIEAIGDEGAVLAVKLADIGWIGAHWEKLGRLHPSGSLPALGARTKEAMGTQWPLLNGDWLASTAMRQPLYSELLGLPRELEELESVLGIDTTPDASGRTIRRAALRKSAVTRGGRLIERRARPGGEPFWLAYDFSGSTGDQDIFARPLGPGETAGSTPPFKPDGTRTLFSLPNGFVALAVHDPDGQLRHQVAPGIDKPDIGDGAGGGASTCLGCHASGLKPVSDELRAAVEADLGEGASEVRDTVLALHPGAPELAKLFDDDNYRYRRALVQAGVDPDLTLHGLEIINTLARRYREDVDLKRAAAEAGLDEEALIASLETIRDAAKPAARQLRQGLLGRAQADALLARLKAKSTGVATAEDPVSPADLTPASTTAGIGLWLWSERPIYNVGEAATFTIVPSADCYLTLISIDTREKATVLFPNDFQQDNLIRAGTPFTFPGETAPFQLRLKDKGRETVVARCSTWPQTPAAITHDFTRQRFTYLGDWSGFLRMSLEKGVKDLSAAGKAVQESERPRRRGSRRVPKRERKASTTPPAPAQPELVGGTAITFTIQ